MNQYDLPGMKVMHQQAYENLQETWEAAKRSRDYDTAAEVAREARQYIARYGPIFARSETQRMLDQRASSPIHRSSDRYPFMPVPEQIAPRKASTPSPLPAPKRTTDHPPVYQPASQDESSSLSYSFVPQPPPHPGERPSFSTGDDEAETKTKYQYVYGMKDLRMGNARYHDSSVLVSKPMRIRGNVMEIDLEAFEDHPVLRSNTTDRHTDIEYAVSFVDTPTADDWHPILPKQADRIYNERLLFQTARTARLRFPARATSNPMPTVFKNNKPMASRSWALTDGGQTLQLLDDYDPEATYAMAYQVNENVTNPWAIDLAQLNPTRQKHTERFPGGTSSNKSIQLSRYPFVDYEQISEGFDPNHGSYQPVRVSLEQASISGPDRTVVKQVRPEDTGDEIVTRNITDYQDQTWAQPAPYVLDEDNRHLVFEYAHAKDRLYFSETFHPTDLYANMETNHGYGTIRVDYETLVSDFRLKIIFRNNHHTNEGISPRVENFRMHFHIME